MDTKEIMTVLAEIGVAIIATSGDGVDGSRKLPADGELKVLNLGQPHARPIHIGHADETGVYFMTSPETKFYQQLMANDRIAITAFSEDDYLIQVIRIEGQARAIDYKQLKELLNNNPYVEQVYPDADKRSYIQVFHCYQGKGFYHSLTQGHKYEFEFGQ